MFQESLQSTLKIQKKLSNIFKKYLLLLSFLSRCLFLDKPASPHLDVFTKNRGSFPESTKTRFLPSMGALNCILKTFFHIIISCGFTSNIWCFYSEQKTGSVSSISKALLENNLRGKLVQIPLSNEAHSIVQNVPFFREFWVSCWIKRLKKIECSNSHMLVYKSTFTEAQRTKW